MLEAPWTYELPATGSAAENLDDYEARTAEGAHAGIVTGLVARNGDLYVLVDAGRLPPLTHRRLAVRLAGVAEVDHDALVVRLRADRGGMQEVALVLDPAKARHDDEAEAIRVDRLPAGLASSTTAGSGGPVETASSFVALAVVALSTYSLLAVVGVWSAHGLAGWAYAVFALPALLAVLGFAAAGYRLYRSPHLGHPARTA